MHPKLTPGMPDSYGIKVTFITGKTLDYTVVAHSWLYEGQVLSIMTTDDEGKMLPMSSILEVTFDRTFQRIVEMKQKLEGKS